MPLKIVHSMCVAPQTARRQADDRNEHRHGFKITRQLFMMLSAVDRTETTCLPLDDHPTALPLFSSILLDFLEPQSKVSGPPPGATSPPPPDAALSLGMAFVEAAGASPLLSSSSRTANNAAAPKTAVDGGVGGETGDATVSAALSTTGLSELDQLR